MREFQAESETPAPPRIVSVRNDDDRPLAVALGETAQAVLGPGGSVRLEAPEATTLRVSVPGVEECDGTAELPAPDGDVVVVLSAGPDSCADGSARPVVTVAPA